MLEKNECVELEIVDMSTAGDGIGKVDGYALFVKDTVIGDLVEVKVIKAKKNYGFGRLIRIVQASADRVQERCPIARQCGGCQLQALSYEQQLEFKRRKVENNLKRLGKLEGVEVGAVIGMEDPWNYRNKAQFPIGTDKDGRLIAGFYAGRTHHIVETEECCIGVPVNKEVLKCVLAYMEECKVSAYNERTGEGLVRHVLIRYGFVTGEVMVCLVVNGRRLPQVDRLAEGLKRIEGMTSVVLNVNQARTNVILGAETKLLWGQEYITDYIGDVEFRISPLSFYQVNPIQTKVLYDLAVEYAGLTGHEVVWDLYCGIGTISLYLAGKAKMVYGVEIVPEAIADANENKKINGILNAEFFVGKAEEVMPKMYAKDQVKGDVVIVDPPRKGCDEKLLDTIVEMGPHRVVYVSCDSATLARDLRYLCDRGYEVERVQAIDLFPASVHCEICVKICRKQ